MDGRLRVGGRPSSMKAMNPPKPIPLFLHAAPQAFRVLAVVLSLGLSAAAAAQAPSAPGSPKPVPSSYRGFSLGMGLEELKAALTEDKLFAFRGDRDVSLLPRSEQVLVETTGLSFVRRAFFQLRNGKVFMMAFSLDPETVDHYSVFTRLTSEYGEPATLDPREAVWLSPTVRLSVERPLTVKYIDMVVFEELAKASSVKSSTEFELRQEFLNGF
jgi:hypothetical protein